MTTKNKTLLTGSKTVRQIRGSKALKALIASNKNLTKSVIKLNSKFDTFLSLLLHGSKSGF